jgi:hypothetical protein
MTEDGSSARAGSQMADKPPTSRACHISRLRLGECAALRLEREVAQKIVEPRYELFSVAHDLVFLLINAALRANQGIVSPRDIFEESRDALDHL